jgi:hypothetical protein
VALADAQKVGQVLYPVVLVGLAWRHATVVLLGETRRATTDAVSDGGPLTDHRSLMVEPIAIPMAFAGLGSSRHGQCKESGSRKQNRVSHGPSSISAIG